MGYSVNFYLDKSISEKRQKEITNSRDKALIKEINSIIENNTLQIFVYLRYSGKTIKVYIERKCTQKQWDSQKQRVNPRYYKSGATPLNNYLNKLSNDISELYERNLSKDITTNKGHLKDLVFKANDKVLSNHTFLSAFEEFIEVSSINKQKSTITVYKTLLKHLKNFSATKRFNLQFETIDKIFEDKFRSYLIREVNQTNNTVAKNFKTLKTFLNYSTERGYNTKLDYIKFDAREKEKEVYALTKEELMRIFNFDFNETRLDRVRDLFCFSCFTGLRFGDILSLTRSNIKEDYIDITNQKTNKRLIIPINRYAKAILDKYQSITTPLPLISSQKTNQYLKEIGQLAEINDTVRIITYQGAKRIENNVPKHQVLTFHVARKTFITVSLVLGMHERAVKEISGHKKDTTFQKYVKFADSYLVEETNDKWGRLSE